MCLPDGTTRQNLFTKRWTWNVRWKGINMKAVYHISPCLYLLFCFILVCISLESNIEKKSIFIISLTIRFFVILRLSTLLGFLLEICQEFPFNRYFNRTTGRRSVHRYLLEGLQRSKIRRRRYLLAGCKRNCTRFLRNCDSSRIAWKRRTKAMRSLAIGNLPPWWWTGTFFTQYYKLLFISIFRY